jgi:tRNA dimethylallyltransferase
VRDPPRGPGATSERPLRFLAILGPTASGKSALGLALAERLGGEIVCCDSQQVYVGMDVGTAKPTPAERARVPHHALDLVPPDEPFHAARWAVVARAAIAAIHGRGRLPIVVGGTGLYYRALVAGLFEAPPSDPAIRARHQDRAARDGVPALHAALAAVDPEAAAAIRPNDLVRISRALEVLEQTGVPISTLRRRAAPPHDLAPTVLRLDPTLDTLRARIAARVAEMLAAGFLDEVRALRAAGYGPACKPLQALGYRQLGAVLDGTMTLADATTQTIQATVQYARRQRTWFRGEAAALRLDVPPSLEPALEAAARALESGEAVG